MIHGHASAVLFNRSIALQRIGGDEDLLREIASLFLAEYPSLMEEIRQAIKAGDAPALERAAHSLKGSVANFEAPAAMHASFHLESIGRSGEMGAAVPALGALERAFAPLLPALSDLSEG